MGPVFISYAREDRARAELLAEALSANGFEVWWDREIRPGEPSFHRAIQEALERASCVLVLWSVHSVESRYVEVEVSFGWDRGMLVPVLIEEIAGRVPIAFRTVQAANLTDWKGDPSDPALLGLEAAIAEHVSERPTGLLGKIGSALREAGPGLRRTVRRLDRWDALVMGGLAFAALGAWGLAGPRSVVLREELFWGAGAFLAFLAWLAARGVWRERWFPARRRFLRALGRAGGLAAAVGVWGFAANVVYGIPSVPADRHGVVVARLEGDDGDAARTRVVRALQDRIPVDGLTDAIVVLGAPRRVGTEIEARALGRRADAAMVIWGRVDAWSAEGAPIIVGHLTPVDVPGVFDPRALPAAGVPGLAGELPTVTLKGELGTLQRILPRFLAGYALYRDGQPERAATYMRAVAAELEHDSATDGERTLSETVLASAHFYLGNAAVLRDDPENARSHYRAAVQHSLHPSEENRPQFLQPLNNLGMIFSWEGRSDSAIARFEQADAECRSAPVNPFCAYVWYNLANEYGRASRYRDARERYGHVAARLTDLDRGGPDTARSRLLGYAYRGLAYTGSRMAAARPDARPRVAGYRSALEEWEAAVRAFRQAGLEVPPDFAITRARIDLGLGRWDEAAARLDSAEAKLPQHPTVALLRAVLETCTDRMPAAAASIQRYLALASSAADPGMRQAAEGMEELRELSNGCAATTGG